MVTCTCRSIVQVSALACCIHTKSAIFGSPFFIKLILGVCWYTQCSHTHTLYIIIILTLWQCWTAQASSRNNSFASVSDNPSLSSTWSNSSPPGRYSMANTKCSEVSNAAQTKQYSVNNVAKCCKILQTLILYASSSNYIVLSTGSFSAYFLWVSQCCHDCLRSSCCWSLFVLFAGSWCWVPSCRSSSVQLLVVWVGV